MIKKINRAGVDILTNEAVQSNASNELAPEREFEEMNKPGYWEEDEDLFPEEEDPWDEDDKTIIKAQIRAAEAKLKNIQSQISQLKKSLGVDNNA